MAEHPEVERQLSELKELRKQGRVREVADGLGALLKTVSRTFQPRDLDHSLKTFRGTVALLKADTDRCQQRFESAFVSWHPDVRNTENYHLLQFELRQLIRTFFAEVEGTVYSGRQLILWSADRKEIDLTTPELALLREESYRFNRRKKSAEAKPAFTSTLDSLLLTLTILPRLFGSETELDHSDHGWEAFQQLLEVRNTVTHPKEMISLVVDAKIVTKTLPAARDWYYGQLLVAVHDPLLPAVLQGDA